MAGFPVAACGAVSSVCGYLYPSILAFATVGVYAVNNSVVDLWIMGGAGLLGYILRKLDFELAPIVLGLVLAPMLELSFRQSLAMSAGKYSIFFDRPITATMLLVGLTCLLLGMRSIFARALKWRVVSGLEPASGQERKGNP